MEPITVKAMDAAIALVTTAILTGIWAIARKRYKLLNQRDALLAEVQQTLLAVRDDNRCQYTASIHGIADTSDLVFTDSGFGYRVS